MLFSILETDRQVYTVKNLSPPLCSPATNFLSEGRKHKSLLVHPFWVNWSLNEQTYTNTCITPLWVGSVHMCLQEHIGLIHMKPVAWRAVSHGPTTQASFPSPPCSLRPPIAHPLPPPWLWPPPLGAHLLGISSFLLPHVHKWWLSSNTSKLEPPHPLSCTLGLYLQ